MFALIKILTSSIDCPRGVTADLVAIELNAGLIAFTVDRKPTSHRRGSN
jgi:hypothetical protein